ncbi:hypothetical protein [Nonomuraea sp. NPDC023979]|uniref:hypothetical protein n=1 Tax=Nonomuraea sp. NPDC023979 TaxID=3154796 RepID=UPI0033D65924
MPKSTYSRLWKGQHVRAGITGRLSMGVAAAQMAEWAGHGMEVLQRICRRCVTGHDEVWIERVNRAREHRQ